MFWYSAPRHALAVSDAPATVSQIYKFVIVLGVGTYSRVPNTVPAGVIMRPADDAPSRS